MYYPLNLIDRNTNVFPLFEDQLVGAPHVHDFSSNNPDTDTYDTANFDEFQRVVFDSLKKAGCNWGIGRYLEERRNVLRNYPQIIDENRVYHLGLDIIVPEGFKLYAPLAGVAYKVGIEEGVGNYGGYVVLRHEVNRVGFYAFYGHLNSNHIVKEGNSINMGDHFGTIGERGDSGGWFTHTHLQIITEIANDEGRLFQAYIAPNEIHRVEELFPNPYCLFQY